MGYLMRQNKNFLGMFQKKMKNTHFGSMHISGNIQSSYRDVYLSCGYIVFDVSDRICFKEDNDKIYICADLSSKFNLVFNFSISGYVKSKLEGYFNNYAVFYQDIDIVREHREKDIIGCDIEDTIAFRKLSNDLYRVQENGIFVKCDPKMGFKSSDKFLIIAWLDFSKSVFHYCFDPYVSKIRGRGWNDIPMVSALYSVDSMVAPIGGVSYR